MIEAELPDGTILEFPEGTDPAVVQRAVKAQMGIESVADTSPIDDQRIDEAVPEGMTALNAPNYNDVVQQPERTPQEILAADPDLGGYSPEQELVSDLADAFGISAIKESVVDPVRRGFNLAQRNNAVLLGGEKGPAQIAAQQADLNAIPDSGRMQELQRKVSEADGWTGAAGEFWDNKRAVVELAMQSLGQSAPGMALGAVAGAPGGPIGSIVGGMAGAGTGSLMMEATSHVVGSMEQAGVDLNDPAQVQAFMSDEQRMSELYEYGLQRGWPIAALDAVSMGIAGRIFKPLSNALKTGEEAGSVAKTVAGATEVGVQGALGGAGEALGATNVGEEIDKFGVLAEVFGETVTGGAEIGINYLNDQGPAQDQLSMGDLFEQQEPTMGDGNVGPTGPSDPSLGDIALGDEVDDFLPTAAEVADNTPGQEASSQGSAPIESPDTSPAQATPESGALPTDAESAIPTYPETRSKVTTARKRDIETEYALVGLDDVTTSDAEGYPSELQPRDRGNRQASDEQIRDIVNDFDPNRLGNSAEADRGAPIVGPDGVVESGNGRVMAIREALKDPAKRKAYEQMVFDETGKFVGDDEPKMLVRVRKTDMTPEERQAFAIEANESATGAMSDTERANADAAMIDDAVIGQLQPGDIMSAANGPFIQSFMSKVSQADRGQFIGPDGELTQSGLKRITAAVLAKAYGNKDNPIANATLSRMLESTDSNVKSITNALTEVAPQFAQLSRGIDEGRIGGEWNLGPSIVESVETVSKLRESKTSVTQWLDQGDIFGEGDPMVPLLIAAFHNGDKAASAKVIGEILRYYANSAINTAQSQDMFGGADLTPEGALNEGIQRGKGQEGQSRENETDDGDAGSNAPVESPANEGEGGQAGGANQTGVSGGVQNPTEGGSQTETGEAESTIAKEAKERSHYYKEANARAYHYVEELIEEVGDLKPRSDEGKARLEEIAAEVNVPAGHNVRPRITGFLEGVLEVFDVLDDDTYSYIISQGRTFNEINNQIENGLRRSDESMEQVTLGLGLRPLDVSGQDQQIASNDEIAARVTNFMLDRNGVDESGKVEIGEGTERGSDETANEEGSGETGQLPQQPAEEGESGEGEQGEEATGQEEEAGAKEQSPAYLARLAEADARVERMSDKVLSDALNGTLVQEKLSYVVGNFEMAISDLKEGRTEVSIDRSDASYMFEYYGDPEGFFDVLEEFEGEIDGYIARETGRDVDETYWKEFGPRDDSRKYEFADDAKGTTYKAYTDPDLPAEMLVTTDWTTELFSNDQVTLSLHRKPHNNKDVVTYDEATDIVEGWKEHAKAQKGMVGLDGKTNSERTVIFLFEESGVAIQPWVDAGYTVYSFDAKNGVDINDIGVDVLYDHIENADDVYAVFAFPPCTVLSSASNARTFAAADADGRTEAAKQLVFDALDIVQKTRPKYWMIENPRGSRIGQSMGPTKRNPDQEAWSVTGLGKPALNFSHYHFGDDFNKPTSLWGNFPAEQIPTANLGGSNKGTANTPGGKNRQSKQARSKFPEGFSNALFMGTNYLDDSAESNLKWHIHDMTGAVEYALEAGLPPEQIYELFYAQGAGRWDEGTVEFIRDVHEDILELQSGDSKEAVASGPIKPEGLSPAQSTLWDRAARNDWDRLTDVQISYLREAGMHQRYDLTPLRGSGESRSARALEEKGHGKVFTSSASRWDGFWFGIPKETQVEQKAEPDALAPGGKEARDKRGKRSKKVAQFKKSDAELPLVPSLQVYEDAGFDPNKIKAQPIKVQWRIASEQLIEKFGFGKVTKQPQLSYLEAVEHLQDIYTSGQLMVDTLGMHPNLLSLDGNVVNLYLYKVHIEDDGTKRPGTLAYHLMNDSRNSLPVTMQSGVPIPPGKQELAVSRRNSSFAHEWMHGVDARLLHDHAKELLGTPVKYDKNGDLREVGRLLTGKVRLVGVENAWTMSDTVKNAMVDVLNALFFDDAALALYVMDLERKIANARDTSSANYKNNVRKLDEINKGMSKALKPRSIMYKAARDAEGRPDDDLDAYYQTPTEMFARAGEAFIAYKFMKLAINPRGMAENDAHYQTDRVRETLNVYPDPKDRQRIYDAYDKLFLALSQEETLGPRAQVGPKQDVKHWSKDHGFDALSKDEQRALEAARRESEKSKINEEKARRTAKRLRDNVARNAGTKPNKAQVALYVADEFYHRGPFISALTTSIRSKLIYLERKYPGSQGIKDIRKLFASKPGSGEQGLPTLELELQTQLRRFGGMADDMIQAAEGSLSADIGRDLYTLMTSNDIEKLPAKTRSLDAAADKGRKMLDALHNLAMSHGMDLGYAESYLPRKLNQDYLDNTPGAWERFNKVAVTEYRDVFERDIATLPGVQTDPDQAETIYKLAGLWFQNATIYPDEQALYQELKDAREAYEAVKEEEVDSSSEREAFLEAAVELYPAVHQMWAEKSANDYENAARNPDVTWSDTAGVQFGDSQWTQARNLTDKWDERAKEFLMNDAFELISTYTSQVMRRVMIAKYLGRPDSTEKDRQIVAADYGLRGSYSWVENGGPGWKLSAALTEMASKEVSPEDVDEVQRDVAVMLGVFDTQRTKSETAFNASVQAGMTGYILMHSVMAALHEPSMAGVRSGGKRGSKMAVRMQGAVAKRAFIDIGNQINKQLAKRTNMSLPDIAPKAWRDDVEWSRTVGRMLGLFNSTTGAEVMAQKYNLPTFNVKAAKVLQTVFRWNGQHWHMNATIQSLVPEFFDELNEMAVMAMEGDKEAVRYLREMGIIDPLMIEKMADLGPRPSPEAIENFEYFHPLMMAAAKSAQERVMQPNKVDKQTHASLDHGYRHLLTSFLSAFNDLVVQPFRRRMMNSDISVGYKAGMVGGAMIAMMFGLAFWMLRQQMFGKDGWDEEEYWDRFDATDPKFWMTWFDRMGFFGRLSPIMNIASSGIRYDGTSKDLMTGPYYGSILEDVDTIIDVFGRENSPNTYAKERAALVSALDLLGPVGLYIAAHTPIAPYAPAAVAVAGSSAKKRAFAEYIFPKTWSELKADDLKRRKQERQAELERTGIDPGLEEIQERFRSKNNPNNKDEVTGW